MKKEFIKFNKIMRNEEKKIIKYFSNFLENFSKI